MSDLERLASDFGIGRDEAEAVGAFLDLGIAPDRIREALGAGRLERVAVDQVFARLRTGSLFTAREVEAAGGLSVSESQELIAALGLRRPEPEEPYFSAEELGAIKGLKAEADTWPPELYLQIARTYGRALARIARTQVQLFHVYVMPQLRSQERGGLADIQAIALALERLVGLGQPWLVSGWRRLVEREFAQEAASEVEARLGERTPGAVDVTFLFCDIKDFTAFAEISGDHAAIEAIDRFAAIVTEERGESGRILKALGDGYMLSYPEPADAVGAGARMMGRMREAGSVRMHASAHRGVAVAREGDYFGRAVNLAAHMLPLAAGDELLATDPVVESAGRRFTWESVGPRTIRGIGQPVTLHRLTGC